MNKISLELLILEFNIFISAVYSKQVWREGKMI